MASPLGRSVHEAPTGGSEHSSMFEYTGIDGERSFINSQVISNLTFELQRGEPKLTDNDLVRKRTYLSNSGCSSRACTREVT